MTVSLTKPPLNGDASEVKGAQDKRFDGCYLTQPDRFRRAAHNFVVVDAFTRITDADYGFNRHEGFGFVHERFLFRLVHDVLGRVEAGVRVGADAARVVDAAHDGVSDQG